MHGVLATFVSSLAALDSFKYLTRRISYKDIFFDTFNFQASANALVFISTFKSFANPWVLN